MAQCTTKSKRGNNFQAIIIFEIGKAKRGQRKIFKNSLAKCHMITVGV